MSIPGFTTERRAHDWIAFVGDDRTRWEAGATETEAIGKLCMTLQRHIERLEEDAQVIDDNAVRSSQRRSEEIAARDATIDRWRTRAESAERILAGLRDVLVSIERNDKTPEYCYAGQKGDIARAANREGEYPGSGERWATPREIARGALDKIK